MKAILIIIAALILASCGRSKHRFDLTLYDGFDYRTVECDSFKMLSQKQAIAYVNGTQLIIYAGSIVPSSTGN